MPYKDIEKQRKAQREWASRHRDAALNKERKLVNKEFRRLYIQDKKSVPCTDCGGLFHFSAMDFDHVRGVKEFNVSKLATMNRSLERIDEEIAKCEVVCANCHRVRTWRRKNG